MQQSRPGTRPFHLSYVVVQNRFVHATQLATRIIKNKETCDTAGRYLDCCLEFYSIREACKAFSVQHNDPSLAAQDTFLKAYEASVEAASQAQTKKSWPWST